MWPVVAKAIDFVVDLQFSGGEISWARSPSGPEAEALLTGNASIYHSIRCALALADYSTIRSRSGKLRSASWVTRSPITPMRS